MCIALVPHVQRIAAMHRADKSVADLAFVQLAHVNRLLAVKQLSVYQ
jgi:hypothetical protein